MAYVPAYGWIANEAALRYLAFENNMLGTRDEPNPVAQEMRAMEAVVQLAETVIAKSSIPSARYSFVYVGDHIIMPCWVVPMDYAREPLPELLKDRVDKFRKLLGLFALQPKKKHPSGRPPKYYSQEGDCPQHLIGKDVNPNIEMAMWPLPGVDDWGQAEKNEWDRQAKERMANEASGIIESPREITMDDFEAFRDSLP